MPVILVDELKHVIDPDYKDNEITEKITYQNHGPGQFDKWSIMQKKSNSWRQRESGASQSTKKQIIITNWMLTDQIPRANDLSFIAALIENYDVYLWPGEDTPISQCRRVTNTSEFWQLRNTIQPATQSKVQTVLSQQGCAAENYIILDYTTYETAVANFQEEYSALFEKNSGSIFLEKQSIDEKFMRKLHDQVDPDQLRYVKLTAPTCKELDFFAEYFPDIPVYVFVNMTAEWRKINLSTISREYPHLKVRDTRETIICVDERKIKKIAESRKVECRYNEFAKKMQPGMPYTQVELYTMKEKIENISFKHCENVVDLSVNVSKDSKHFPVMSFPALQKIRLAQAAGITELNLNICKDLKNARLEMGTLRYLEMSELKMLESLEITSHDLQKITFHPEQKLQHLTLKECNEEIATIATQPLHHLKSMSLTTRIDEVESKPITINFEPFRQLEKLSIKGSIIPDCSHMPNLQRLEISDSPIAELKVSYGENLKQLSIERCKELKKLDLSQFPNLEELTVEGEHLPYLDFSSLRKLKRLHILTNHSLETKNFSALSQLESLYLNAPPETMPDFRACRNLLDLSVESNSTSSSAKSELPFDIVDLSDLKKLERVQIMDADGSVSHINCSNLSNLKKIYLNLQECSDVSVENNVALQDVTIKTTKDCDVRLNMKNCNNLFSLNIDAKDIKASNLEKCNKLRICKLRSDEKTYNEMIPLIPIDCQMTFVDRASKFEIEKSDTKHSALHMLNKNNSVSVYSLSDDPETIDYSTEAPTTAYTATGTMKFVLNEKYHPDRNHYRLRVLDTIQKGLRFSSNLNKKDCKEVVYEVKKLEDDKLLELQMLSSKKADEGVGYFSGVIEENKLYPLPTQEPQYDLTIKEVYSKPENAISIMYHPQHQQFYFELKPPAKKDEVEILYRYNKNMDYEKKRSGPVLLHKSELMPNELRQAIYKQIEGHPPLQFLFNTELNTDQKIERLEAYCNNFENLALSGHSLGNLLREQKGACRHRSQVFMLLARLIDVPVRMIYNEEHAFCEIPHLDGWRRVDLGGAPRLDLTPLDKRQNIFDSKRKDTPAVTLHKDSSRDLWEEKYFAELSKLLKITEINDIEQLHEKLLEKQELAPLIELTQKQDPIEVKKYLVSQLKDRKDNYSNYVYIHSPADFEMLLRPCRLEKGQRRQLNGPLFDLIQNGGVIIVNWSNFTATEIASYKSIIDAEPTLFGLRIPSTVKVIGLKAPSTASCAAFSSRCQSYVLPQLQQEKKEIAISKAEPVVVDLFKRHDWRDHFLGDISFKGNAIYLEEGPVIRAIRENRPIVIFNPPNDPEFTLLLSQIRDERRIFYNGEFLPVPEGVSVRLANKEHKNEAKNISVSLRDEKSVARRIHLGIHNIHECYEALHVNAKNQAESKPGLLKQYNETKDVFYVTDTISKSDWQILVSHIEQHFPSTQFHFQLAPGGSIEGVKKNTDQPKPITMNFKELTDKPNVILTNDPDFLTEKLSQETNNPLIIDVTPQLGLHDLIAKIHTDEDEKDASKVNFIYEEQHMLRALKSGRRVILNGELSPQLFQQLQPLLTSSPYINVNGARIEPPELKGQLIAVMPSAARTRLMIEDSVQCDFKEIDYRAALSSASTGRDYDISHIFEFFSWAKQLSQGGAGYPAIPQLTYHHLQRMLGLLDEQKLHPHNPIKGAFLFDYPKRSLEYAFLNVMGKYYFRSSDRFPLRLSKLKRLVDQHHITEHNLRDHAWQLLNCFSGQDLHRILGNVHRIVDISSGAPILSDALLQRLWAEIEPKLSQESKEEKKSHVNKREFSLQTLLESKSTPFILLKGGAGVGKTFSVKKLQQELKFAYYEGETAIQNWLEDKSDKPCVLMLDEANMERPGTWDFLKGISRNSQSVYYNGVEYKLSPRHKIIATGNPETYPERYFHPFFQRYAETLHFRMPEDDFLEKEILHKALPSTVSHAESKKLLSSYHLIQKYNPTYVYSNRDLENLAQRFNVIIADPSKSESLDSQLLSVCVAEFAGTIPDLEKRQRFISHLAKDLGIPPSDKKVMTETMLEVKAADNTLLIPQQNDYLVRGIEQAIQIREYNMSLEKKDDGRRFYKRGVLIEGNPGLGKSTLIKALLEKHGFTNDAKDTQRRYYEISAGDRNAHAVLKRAFNEGSAVILDELNLDPSLELLLNQLLTGKDAGGNFPTRPGFMVLASQNPSHELGRKSVSAALRNRLHMMYMNPYSNESLEAIAIHAKVEEPRSLVSAFKRLPKATMRTLYTELRMKSETGLSKRPSM